MLQKVPVQEKHEYPILLLRAYLVRCKRKHPTPLYVARAQWVEDAIDLLLKDRKNEL